MLFRVVATAAALATGVAGFYPYMPEYRCIEMGNCLGSTDSKRSEGAAAGLPTFNVVKKTAKAQLSPETRLARLVERLKRRYQGIEERDNNYSIDFGNTPSQATSAALDQDGTDYSYFAVVDFGSSSTPLYLLMDTGASSTWVMGSSCTSSACETHNTFGTDDSTTLDVTTDSFSISYGSGTVSGVYASDSLSLAGLDITMTFGLANETSSDFLNFPIDGIMGLSLVTGKNPTVMQVIKNSGLLSANVFGINLSRASDDDNDGEINFGAPDTSKYDGDLSYSSVTATSGEWAIGLGDVGANGETAGLSGKSAYIDSGTSYIFAPPDDAKALHDLIPNSQLSDDGNTWYVPCDTTLPVQFEFNNVWYNVSSEDWVGGKVGSLCTSNIYPQDVIGGGDSWLCGDTFLKNVYALFDADESRIGFGVKGSSTSTSSSSTSSGGITISSSSSTSTGSPGSTSDSVTSSQTGSNAKTTVSSTTSTATGASSSSSGSSGFNGHITSSTTTAATAASITASSSSSSPTKSSSAHQSFGLSSLHIYIALLAAFIVTHLS